MAAKYGSLPFKEQIAFYRNKVRIPTRAWTDLWEGMHARAFVVAGAMRDELLADLQTAVGSAIEQGTTLAQFRKDFDQIVAKHGWSYKGGRGWRTRVIYETNLRTSYQAGRYQQMQAVKATRPYWRYRHNDSVANPRPQHQAWDGLVLLADDAFWSTHFPPNGWGCRCFVETLSERDLKTLGKDGPDTAPPINLQEVTVGTRGPSPRTVNVPDGIDPGWGYNVGEAAWGRPLSQDAMNAWRAQGADAWESLTPAGWAEAGRPDVLPLASAPRLGRQATDTQAAIATLEAQLGGAEKIYRPGGLPVLVNARTLGEHLDPARTEFLPLLDELLTDPYETWIAFERHNATGQVALRARIVKAFDLGGGRYALAVANARRGMLEGWTFFMVSDRKYINKQRRGILLQGKD